MKIRPALAPLLPLVALYQSVLAVNDVALARGWRRTEHLRWPVVSIGNLSVGGAGKTPVVIHLARLLTEAGLSVDVLSRGYGRSSRVVTQVDPRGSAEEFGDEPLLIARAAGVPVFVGGSRYAAGLLAEQALPPTAALRLHLLDDGFQHRQLARAVDIVLMHRTDFAAGLLPAGRLREPLRALGRADVVVLRAEDADLEPQARRYAHANALFWRMERKLLLPSSAKRLLAFCAIARPEEFFSAVRQAGAVPAGTMQWRDHHRYSLHDMAKLKRRAARQAADAFVTTAKDAVKLGPSLRAELESVAPLLIAELETHLSSDAGVIVDLCSLLGSSRLPRAL